MAQHEYHLFHLQAESNGSLSVPKSPASEMEACETKSSSEILENDKDHVHYDFLEEQVPSSVAYMTDS